MTRLAINRRMTTPINPIMIYELRLIPERSTVDELDADALPETAPLETTLSSVVSPLELPLLPLPPEPEFELVLLSKMSWTRWLLSILNSEAASNGFVTCGKCRGINTHRLNSKTKTYRKELYVGSTFISSCPCSEVEY
jgi:hypothetical protein